MAATQVSPSIRPPSTPDTIQKSHGFPLPQAPVDRVSLDRQDFELIKSYSSSSPPRQTMRNEEIYAIKDLVAVNDGVWKTSGETKHTVQHPPNSC